MAKKIVLMGLFTDVMKTAEALDGLRLLGLREEDMSIMQGVPYTSKMLGRPQDSRAGPLGHHPRRADGH